MSITIGDAVLYLRGDRSRLNSDLDKSEQETQTWAGRIGEKINKELGKKLAMVGGMLSAAVTAPLVALASSSIDAASDLEESLSKVNVVFGDSATEIEAWSDTAAKAMGQSQQQALEAVGTYGNLFTAMGIGQEAAAGMSMELVELASDLASFNNIEPTVALEKLRAGLTGQTEPLKTLGVNLNAAMIEAKALELGLTDGEAALTAAQKAQASYALILEQTTNAQGDFIRTSDGLANQQRITMAMMDDARAQLGEKLLPIKLKMVQMIQSLIEKFTNLSPKTQEIILLVAGLAAGLGPLLMVAGGVVSVISALAPVVGAAGAALAFLISPVGLAIAAIVALIAIGVLVVKNWETIKRSAVEIWTSLTQWLSRTWEDVRRSAANLWNRVADSVRDGVDAARRWAIEKFTGIVTWFRELPAKMLDAGKNIVEGIKTGIGNAWDSFMRWIKDKLAGFKTTVLSFFGIHSPSAMFADIGRQLMAGLGEGIESGVEIPVRASLALGANLASIMNGGPRGANSYMTVYGGVALHGVQDRQGLLQEMQGMMV